MLADRREVYRYDIYKILDGVDFTAFFSSPPNMTEKVPNILIFVYGAPHNLFHTIKKISGRKPPEGSYDFGF